MKTKKRFLSILLSLALVLGLMPGMSMTAYADVPYASLKNATTEITFDGKSWYLIDYDDSTVTLLAKECVGSSLYNASGSFVEYSNNPTVKTAVDNWYRDNITSDAKTAVSGSGMFLLTKEEADEITNAEVRKCENASGGGWWLCSQGDSDSYAAYVLGGSGDVFAYGDPVPNTHGVRPALKLNLSSVIFSSESNAFSLKPSDNTVTWSDVSDIEIEDWESVTEDGVTVTLGSHSRFMNGDLNLGSCIFTASQGGISGITIQTGYDLYEPSGGWPSGWIADGSTLTWSGDPAVEVSLEGMFLYISSIQQITFTMSDTGTGTKTVWTNETIEIDGEVTVNRRIIVNGNVTLNLKEGSKLIANAGINVSAGNSLTIQGSGELIARIDEQQSLQADNDMAAIGGNSEQNAGTITITGGTIEAHGGANAAGIGGGDHGNGGTINISGGTVTAIGGSFGAGIGGGNSGNGGTVNISGGTVIATGGQYGKNGGSSSGIGKSGYGSDDGTLTLGDSVLMQVSSDNTTWSEYGGSDRARYMKSHIPAIDILVTGLTLDKTTTQIIDVGNKVSFTATVAPDNASDKTVKWSVGGTDADAVTLYSDEACETAVTLDTATSTLTVYAKGVSAGSATVTCTSNADSTKSASCVVTVNVVASYPLWVGGVQVTRANKDDVLGNTDEGATVSYDVDTNTLTLNGADIAAGYTDPTYNDTSGIYYSGNDSLSIVLSTGTDNKVGVNGNVQIGIKSSNNIRISGAGKLTVKGSGNYSVGIEAYALTIKDAEINVEGALNGIQTQKYGYGVNIISGKVNAIGQTGTGIHSGLRDVNDQTNAVTIGENATVVAIGGNKAINYLKNAIAGTGWTDPEDNTSKTTISISSEGQSIDTLKKMAFPKLPASTVTTPPEANNLTFTGSAQELVIAGVASNGEMQYAIGTNMTTAPTSGWSASIPTKTDAGTYYVWYKVVGDSTHTDTEPVSITVTIANRPSTPYVPYVPSNPAPAPASEAYTVPVSNENTVDISVNISEGNAVVQEITQADLDKITDDTSGSGSDGEKKTDDTKISVDVSGAKSEVTSVELSGISVETLAKTVEENERVDSVEIKLTNATVELDSAAVSAISEQKEGNTIKLVVENKEQTKLNETQKESLKSFTSVKPFQAYFESGGKEIHDFKGGKATVSIKFSPEAGRDAKYYHVYYVPLSGLIERYVTRYLNGWFSYTTSHFSDYAIVYDATMENETGKEDVTPSPSPSTAPSASPSVVPSASPSPAPSASTEPSVAPSASVEPSTAPSTVPSQAPSEGKTGPVTAQEQAQAVLDINAGLKVVHNGTSASVQWGKVDGAKYYKVYAAYCGSKYKMIKTVDAAAKCKVTIKKLNGKKLSTTKNIKVYVAAYRTVETKNGEAVTKKDVRIAKTIAGHVVGKKNTKYSNAKKIKLSKTSYTLKKGKKVKIKAKTVLQYPKRKQLGDAHAKEFRYATSDKSIATVSKSGKITAKKKGSCVIYVYARNGLAKKVKVTVK